MNTEMIKIDHIYAIKMRESHESFEYNIQNYITFSKDLYGRVILTKFVSN